MSELKPCPNPECENPDVYLDDARETNGSGILFSCCDRCGFRGPNVEFVPGRLEEAEPEAARLHNAMPREEPWIPVTERLPEVNTHVIALEFSESLFAYVDQRGRWSEQGREGVICYPTHWRPYREPRRP
jgi:hypothetical protein